MSLILVACGGGGGEDAPTPAGNSSQTSSTPAQTNSGNTNGAVNDNSGDTSNTETTPPSTDNTVSNATVTDMKIGEIYTVKHGQSIAKSSENTVIILETMIETGVTTVMLQSGSATIEQKNN